MPILLPDGMSSSGAAAWLFADGIETKQWYRPFLDERVQFARGAWGPLTATEKIRRSFLGLPFHKRVEKSHVLTIADSLAQYVAASEHIMNLREEA
jgi:dTDP-4-amino-4,6-dideoxygalactose transaminase